MENKEWFTKELFKIYRVTIADKITSHDLVIHFDSLYSVKDYLETIGAGVSVSIFPISVESFYRKTKSEPQADTEAQVEEENAE